MSIFVNKVEISESEVGQEMQYHPAPTPEQAWQLAAQSLVIRQLLLQQAANSGLYPVEDGGIKADEEEKIIDRLLQQEVTVPQADEATCQWFYDSHPDSFVDKASGTRLDFVEAQVLIRDYLHTKAMRAAVAEYIKALSYSADINGFELN